MPATMPVMAAFAPYHSNTRDRDVHGDALLVGLSQHCRCSAVKMRRGIPLDDEDRWPWLHVLAGIIVKHIAEDRRLVMGCSALKEAYRDILRGQHAESVLFVRPC